MVNGVWQSIQKTQSAVSGVLRRVKENRVAAIRAQLKSAKSDLVDAKETETETAADHVFNENKRESAAADLKKFTAAAKRAATLADKHPSEAKHRTALRKANKNLKDVVARVKQVDDDLANARALDISAVEQVELATAFVKELQDKLPASSGRNAAKSPLEKLEAMIASALKLVQETDAWTFDTDDAVVAIKAVTNIINPASGEPVEGSPVDPWWNKHLAD